MSADGDLVNALSASLGRRARRRVRRILGEIDAAAIASIDFEAWRTEFRGMASAFAGFQGKAELRVAVTAWLRPSDGDDAQAIPPEADVSQLVAAHPEACALLRSLISAWVEVL